jgi:U3 small nucleolar RNA-associated protein 20
MAEYQSGKHYEAHLTFLLSQLNFDLQTGRLSALDTLGALINAMPVDRLAILSGLIFIPTAAVLVNDDDPLCRQVAAKTLRSLLLRQDHAGKERLLAITMAWLKDGKVSFFSLFQTITDKLNKMQVFQSVTR